jgi:hypothetical protein
MLTVALVLLATAALVGASLLVLALRGRHTPKGIALLHGVLAAAGIIVLAITWLVVGEAPRLALTLFVIAAGGGAVVLALDLRRGGVPKPLAVGHGLIALAALALLVRFWLAR